MSEHKLTAFRVVVVHVAVSVPDPAHIPAVFHHVDGDVVVIHTRRCRVDAVVPVIATCVVQTVLTSALAAVSTVVR